MKRVLLVVCLLTSLVTPAVAQAPVVASLGSTLTFTPSPDHDVTAATVAVLTSYEVHIRNATTVVFTRDVGKPANASTLTVPIGWTAAQLSALASGAYTATVSAKGPGGTTESAPSDPFAVLTSPRAPGKPGVVR